MYPPVRIMVPRRYGSGSGIRSRGRPYDGEVRLKSTRPDRLGGRGAGGARRASCSCVVHTPPVVRRVPRMGGARRSPPPGSSTCRRRRSTTTCSPRRVSLSDVRLSAPGHADAALLRRPPRVGGAAVGGVPRHRPHLVARRRRRRRAARARGRRAREPAAVLGAAAARGAAPPRSARPASSRNLDVDYVDRTGDIDVTVRGLQARAHRARRPHLLGRERVDHRGEHRGAGRRATRRPAVRWRAAWPSTAATCRCSS